jgi:hypothetical protein
MNDEEEYSSCDRDSEWNNDKDRDIERFIPSASERADTLCRYVRELPRVDEDGHCECGFAAILFGKVKEERERVAFSVELAQRFFPSIDRALSQCHKKIAWIEREREELAERGARMELGEDLGGQQWLCEHLVDLQERLSALIDRLQDALSQADSVPTLADEE